MYCTAATVRFLAKNVRSPLTDDEIAAAASVVEPEIDTKLARRYYWPKSKSGADLTGTPPRAVVAIANTLVAAMLEMGHTAFAAGVGGPEAMQHPYGTSLQRIGRRKLLDATEGDDVIPELEQRTPGRVSRPPKKFNTVSGFGGTRTGKGFDL